MYAISVPAIAALSVDQLTGRLHELRREERQRLVELLLHLGELERREVLLGLGFSGIFAFCTDYLGYTRSAAYRRTTAARLLARFPQIADYLADGRLCLTTLCELRNVLEPERLDEILSRAAGRTEDDVRMLVAALRPRPAPPELLRRLPTRAPEAVREAPPSSGPAVPSSAGAGPAPEVASSAGAGPAPAVVSNAIPAPIPRDRLEPIAEDRFVLRVTVDAAFVEELQQLRAALSHKLPAGGLAELLRESVRATLAAANRRKMGAPRPAPEATSSAKGVSHERTPAPDVAQHTPRVRRAIPAALRKAVWERDGHRCAFVAPSGRRCNSTHQLELHHVVPLARGGPDTVENLTLRCRVHNHHAAVKDFGREHMESVRHRQQLALL